MTLNIQSPNKEQKEVIEYDEHSNIGIIAGPGSGKTFVIIERIRFYLSQRIEPRKILLVTYTNRGIMEIKKRINTFTRARKEFEYAGTLHSICKKFLEGELRSELSSILNIEINRLSIIDTQDRYFFLNSEIKNQIENLFSEKSNDYREYVWEIVLEETENSISRNKIENYVNCNFKFKVMNYEWYSSRLIKKMEKSSLSRSLVFEVLHNVFIAYQSYLDMQKLFDFDDLIIYFHYVIHNNLERKKEIQSYFEKILVDEFQDMNFLQLLIISEISGSKKNIFFVGDPNQAIYGFQGAYPEIFQYFKTHVDSSTKFFHLSRNYRSTRNILDLSHRLILNNNQKNILNKMFTDKSPGDRISWIITDKRGEVFRKIYSIIKHLESEGVNFNSIAIISRTHMETKKLRRKLWDKKVKFLDFNFSKYIAWNYESYFLICVLSLRFKVDKFAIQFIIEYFFKKEEIEEYFYEHMIEYSDDLYLSLREMVKNNFGNRWTSYSDRLKIKKIKKMWHLIRIEIAYQNREPKYRDWDRWIISSSSALEEYIKIHSTSELLKIISSSKFLSIKNILNFYRILTFYSGKTIFNIGELIELLLVYTKHFVNHITEDNYLNFSTIHGAKGCEFDYVFILNLIEGKFPKHYALSVQDIEEERRILFVAMTRAKKKLYIISDLYKNDRFKADGKKDGPKISKFLEEVSFLDKDNLEVEILNYSTSLHHPNLSKLS